MDPVFQRDEWVGGISKRKQLTNRQQVLAKFMAINDTKWQILFEQYDIVNQVKLNGYFDITAPQIKKVREPRLMCKMDFRQSVSKPFRDNDLSILAIQNGIYRIAKTSPFFDIDLQEIGKINAQEFHLPSFIETLDYENITSESQALDAAVASGMLNELLQEESYLTVRGRRYSSSINIDIKESDSDRIQNYPISSVQIEVDGGYEGPTTLALIEAKMGTADNMNMRQLIYPHVNFEAITKKTVKTFVMFYETGSLFTFIPMAYEDGIASLIYADTKRYKLAKSLGKKAKPDDLIKTLPKPGNGAPFPQADDFEKVLFGFFKVAESEQTEEDIFSKLPVVPRQYNYYFNAMKWLGLVDKTKKGAPVHLTKFGEKVLDLSERERLDVLYSIMRQNEVVQHIIEKPNAPLSEKLKSENGLMGTSMYPRRRSTIIAWLKFFNEKLSE